MIKNRFLIVSFSIILLSTLLVGCISLFRRAPTVVGYFLFPTIENKPDFELQSGFELIIERENPGELIGVLNQGIVFSDEHERLVYIPYKSVANEKEISLSVDVDADIEDLQFIKNASQKPRFMLINPDNGEMWLIDFSNFNPSVAGLGELKDTRTILLRDFSFYQSN